jgi:hypothetical protein
VINADSNLRVLDRVGAVAVAASILYYYRQRLNSVEVDVQLRIRPEAVRVLLMRLNRTWERMSAGPVRVD